MKGWNKLNWYSSKVSWNQKWVPDGLVMGHICPTTNWHDNEISEKNRRGEKRRPEIWKEYDHDCTARWRIWTYGLVEAGKVWKSLEKTLQSFDRS